MTVQDERLGGLHEFYDANIADVIFPAFKQQLEADKNVFEFPYDFTELCSVLPAQVEKKRMVLDLRSDKRKNDDLLDIPQRSFKDQLSTFDIRPVIIDMTESTSSF